MKAFVYTFLLFNILNSFAQDKLSDRIYYGGGFGFSANSNQTNVSLSPQIGYKITQRYSAGIGIIYQFVGVKNPEVSLHHYGWSIFNRFNITEQFFAFGEFERLSFEYFTSNSLEQKDRLGYNSLLIGGGYSEQLSRSASFSITVLYNLLYDVTDEFQPYNSPLVVRAGIGIGIF